MADRLNKLLGNLEAEIVLAPFVAVAIAAVVGFVVGWML